ncbi:hypothetical protein DdX_15220 [Ditylenchus destructor]|uniref:Uncharacterized protein n=1 Tax=Ditylenchus destructor TaxID=166010 RepID=A0AAD4QUY7_9BILA|nr:hypothetical protein DdX_15220 [Ditylenchus destructor]
MSNQPRSRSPAKPLGHGPSQFVFKPIYSDDPQNSSNMSEFVNGYNGNRSGRQSVPLFPSHWENSPHQQGRFPTNFNAKNQHGMNGFGHRSAADDQFYNLAPVQTENNRFGRPSLPGWPKKLHPGNHAQDAGPGSWQDQNSRGASASGPSVVLGASRVKTIATPADRRGGDRGSTNGSDSTEPAVPKEIDELLSSYAESVPVGGHTPNSRQLPAQATHSSITPANSHQQPPATNGFSNNASKVSQRNPPPPYNQIRSYNQLQRQGVIHESGGGHFVGHNLEQRDHNYNTQPRRPNTVLGEPFDFSRVPNPAFRQNPNQPNSTQQDQFRHNYSNRNAETIGRLDLAVPQDHYEVDSRPDNIEVVRARSKPVSGSRRDKVVPLHIRNPFLYPTDDSVHDQGKPRPYHRTLSLPITAQRRSNTATSESWTNDRNQTQKKDQIQSATWNSSKSKGPDPGDIELLASALITEEELQQEEEDMSKTTPNWKNSFAAVKDRFGQTNQQLQPTGNKTVPRMSNGYGGNSAQTQQNFVDNRDSLLKSAINNAVAGSPATSNGRKGSKEGLSSFWLERVNSRGDSPQPQRLPLGLTAAERLEQLHEEAIQELDRRSAAPIESNTYPYRGTPASRPGLVEGVAARRSNYLRETFRSQSPSIVVANGPIGYSSDRFTPAPQPNLANHANRSFSADYSAQFATQNDNPRRSPNFASLDNAVDEINTHERSPTKFSAENFGRGCGRFPTSMTAIGAESGIKYGSTLQPPQRAKQHSPSPDTLSDISGLDQPGVLETPMSQRSAENRLRSDQSDSSSLLWLLPHPRPKHNIRQQLMAANSWMPGGGQTATSHLSQSRPNFPTPTSNSVAMRVSAFEQTGTGPLTVGTAGGSSGGPGIPTGPMSPKSTVFRTKPVIHFSYGDQTPSSTPQENISNIVPDTKHVGSLGCRLKFPSSTRQSAGKVGRIYKKECLCLTLLTSTNSIITAQQR